MGSVHDDNGTLGSIDSGTPATKSVVRPPGAVEQLLETEAHITRIGSYVPLHKLGQGGMGVVYAAYDEKLDRKVALKLLRSRGSEVARLRLIREARAMAKLSHPNVAQVYGIEESGEQLCIVVEFVDGVTLKAWLAEATRTREEILDVFRSAGLGLAAAHAAGLVHRDFKPDNVMIRRDKRVLVMDFGLVHTDKSESTDDGDANALDGESGQLTRTGAIVGTPAYMAPEQFLGRDTDARSDQFSFCVALWEALTGQRPFIAESVEKLAEAVTSGRFAQVERREVPVWLREVMMRGLSVEPAQRWPSMDALLGALARDPGQHRRWVVGIAAGLGIGALIAGAVVREVDRRGNALADSKAALAQQQSELEQQRRAIDDAANIQRAQQATLLVGERRGLEALVLAVQAAGPYGPDYMNAPTPVLQALFDVQTVSIAGLSKVIPAEPILQHVFFTPDDAYVVAVMREPRAKIWTAEGMPVGQLDGYVPPDAGPEPTVNGCAIRLSPQGEPIELLTADKTGRVWNGKGELLFSPQTGKIEVNGTWANWADSVISIDPVLWSRQRNVAISPTGKTVVFLDSTRGSLEIWGEGDRPANELVLDSQGHLVAGFAADGSRVVVSRGRGPISVFDAFGKLLGSSRDEPTTWVIAVAPDGTKSITGHQPVGAELRDDSGDTLRSLEGHTGSVRAAAFAHDGQLFATASEDRTTRLWDDSGQVYASLDAREKFRVVSLSFASDANRLAVAGEDTVQLWTAYPPLAIPASVADGQGTMSNDGTLVATGAPLRLYAADGTLLAEAPDVHARHFAFTPNDKSLVVIDESGRLRIWDRFGHAIQESEPNVFANPEGLVFAPDSSRFFVLGNQGSHCIWDLQGLCMARLSSAEKFSEAVFEPNDGYLLTFSESSNSTYVWDGVGNLVGTIPSREFGHVSPTGGRVFTYSADEGPRLWTHSADHIADLAGVEVRRERDSAAGLVRFSPTGEIIAFLLENVVHLWDESGTLLRKIDVGDGSSSLAFAPDGRSFVLGGETAKIWSAEGEILATLDGHSNVVQQLEFSSDGALLLTGSSDVTQLWEVQSQRRLAVLRPGRGRWTLSANDEQILQRSIGFARVWRLPAAAMARACEVLREFPDEYAEVAQVCREPPPK